MARRSTKSRVRPQTRYLGASFFASETVAQKFVEYHHAGEGAAGAHDRDWETSRGNPTVTRRSTDSIRRRTFPPFVTPPRVPCRLPRSSSSPLAPVSAPARGEDAKDVPRARGDGFFPPKFTIRRPGIDPRSPSIPRVRRVRRVPVLDEKRIHASGAVSAPSRAPRGEHASFCEDAHRDWP